MQSGLGSACEQSSPVMCYCRYHVLVVALKFHPQSRTHTCRLTLSKEFNCVFLNRLFLITTRYCFGPVSAFERISFTRLKLSRGYRIYRSNLCLSDANYRIKSQTWVAVRGRWERGRERDIGAGTDSQSYREAGKERYSAWNGFWRPDGFIIS